MYKYMAKIWKKPGESLGEAYKRNLIRWRSEGTVVRIESPTRIDRARGLGFKAKQGIAVVRVKVDRGSRKVPKITGGRRPTRAGRFFTLNKSKQQVAEEKASTKYPNMEVLNSYWVGEDGNYKWYEVILVDPSHPSISNDRDLGWLSRGKHTGRAFRGLTASGKRSRGLKNRAKKGL
jgi:large subunit ribosomal protein L15e